MTSSIHKRALQTQSPVELTAADTETRSDINYTERECVLFLPNFIIGLWLANIVAIGK